MHPWVATLNGWLRRVPVWPGYVVGFVPAAWTFWLGVTNRLGAEPVRALEQELGLFALQLLLVSLTVTPLMQLTRINLIRFRRMIGLMAFYYILLHLAVFVVLDLGMRWALVAEALVKRPFIFVGMAAMLLLVPVAATSNDLSVRRLGAARWKAVHRLVYPASILAAVHYVWLVKSWPLEPLLYAAGMILLVAYRPLRRRLATRRRATA